MIHNKNKQIKQPIKKGIAKVPQVMQLEVLECGAACLAMVLAYYGKWLPLEQVRSDCGVSRDGSSMKHIYLAAKNYGLDVKGYRMGLDSLQKDVDFPCILHWNMNHFVVLCGFKGNKAVINDPARGTVPVSMEELDHSFTGMCLTFSPTENFVPGGKQKSTLDFARKRLKGASVMVAFVALVTLISYLFGIVNPTMSRIFYDRLLTGVAPGWLIPFIVVLSIIGIFQVLTEWAKTVYSLKINGELGIRGNTSYMRKVLRLPMEFFSQRLKGDILQRKETNASIAMVLVQTVAPLFLNTIMMVFYLVVMLRYSVPMTLIGLFCLILNLCTARFVSKKRVNITRVQMLDSAKLSSATIAGISMAETIKASGAEEGYFKKWSGHQAAVIKRKVQFASLNLKAGMAVQFVSTMSGYLVLFFGVVLAVNGDFTLGMITTFQGLLNSFMGPAQTIISAGQTIQEMRTQMERVEDVMEYPDDPLVRDEMPGDVKDYEKLKGDVEIKHVTFGYARLQDPIIRDFSMHVKPGKSVAIVGTSGSGKSTVSKLISGLYRPWEGEITFDGKSAEQIPRVVFTGSLSLVDQEIVLFEDTISDNIRMWDDTIEDKDIILAAKDAQIHEDIINRAGGYQGMLSENGKDLSGGQRQRIEIARALAMNPSILIMDEATSALDARTEYDLVKAIRKRGITCIVIAHRLSTIRDCDEIIVLDKGKIAERGTHDELYSKGGIYTDLVTNE